MSKQTEALDKKAENARELGLDYELPITMQEGEFDCTHAERLCAELKAAHPVTPCTHPSLGACSLREDGTASRWNCVMCGTEFVPKATNRWAEFNEATKRNIKHAEWYLSTHPQPAQQEPVAWLVCENWRKHSLFFTEEGAEDFKNAAQREDDLSGNLARWKAKPLYASQPAQQEPVGKVCHDLDGHIGWNPNLRQLPNEGTALYTSPPASKPWVSLTDEEIQKEFHPLHDTGLQFARAIEAKLKEKNNA